MPESRPQGSDTLRCPECDAPLDNLGRVPASLGADDALRIAVDCQTCATQLQVVAQVSSTWRVIGQGDGSE